MPPPRREPGDIRAIDHRHTDERVHDLETRVLRSGWLAPIRGGLPRVPTRETLPTAAEDYAYQLIAIPGSPTEVYICAQDGGGVWTWTSLI